MKCKRGTFYLLFLIYPIAICTKFIQYNYLPSKYFYDSNLILNLVNSNLLIDDKAYLFAMHFFKIINIFHFDSLLQWSIFLAIIFNTVWFKQLLKKESYNLMQYLFIYSATVLLNIYIFNISKDIIQFIFFEIMYLIVNKKNIKDKTKILICSIILVYEALFFRTYYGIMFLLFITILLIYNLFIKNKKIVLSKIAKIFLGTLVIFFIELFLLSLFSTENYNSILNARSNVNINRMNSADANTIINDYLNVNNKYLNFIGNYLINVLRFFCPLELLFINVKYIFFIIYQSLIF